MIDKVEYGVLWFDEGDLYVECWKDGGVFYIDNFGVDDCDWLW